MNDIRKNLEEEKEIISGTFKLSPGAMISWIILEIPFLVFFVLMLILLINKQNFLIPTIIFGILLLGYNIYQILKLFGIKKSRLTVTNKRVYGNFSIMLMHKKFSYRLDEIENVEMQSFLGRHTLMLQFTQGHGPRQTATAYVAGVPISSGAGVLRIANLKNYKEIYEEMNKLMNSVKNVLDLETDIKMKRINTEERKAEALERMATNNIHDTNDKKSNISYIEELKQLKELLDQGVITQEEYEQEKKEILDNNHK